MKNRADVIGGGILCAISIATGVGAIFLKIGALTEPQPGFFPFVGSLILFLFSGIIILQGFTRGNKVSETSGNRGRPTALVAVMVVLVSALSTVGYVVSTLIASLFILWIMGVKSWRVLIITSLCLSIGTYLLFDKLLGVDLPVGFLTRFGL
jgi:putative tricarboxylic transport membrane protein